MKGEYLRTIGIRLLRLPNGLVLEDPEGFARKVREQIGFVSGGAVSRNKRPLTRPAPRDTLSPRERA